MPGVTFDPASEYYDKTRGYPLGVDEAIRDAILRKVQSDVPSSLSFLEPGVGTGRIALPFIQAGYNFVGVDLSLAMMAQLKNKIASGVEPSANHLSLLQADVMQLPFRENSFDVAIIVHVLHLVDDWQSVLREVDRVIRKPGGYLFIGGDVPARDYSQAPTVQVINKWNSIVQESGITLNSRKAGQSVAVPGRDAFIEDYLKSLGAQTELVNLLEYETLPLSPRQMAEHHTGRMHSADWKIPDDIHAAASKRLEDWLDTECPEPDRAFSITNYFQAIVAKW